MRLRLPLFVSALAIAVPAAAAPPPPPPRFHVPVCPAVFGLAAQQAAFVTQRMRSIGATAGVPLAGEPCKPNAIVIVTKDKAALIKALQQQHPDYFPIEWNAGKIRALENDPAPAVAWQFEGLMTPDNLRIAENTMPGILDPVDPGALVASTAPTTAPASRLRPALKHDVMTSVLVVQSGALAGLTATQFADYAAMRTFARADPATSSAPATGTIVKVLDAPMGTAVPQSITPADLQYLKGYYGS